MKYRRNIPQILYFLKILILEESMKGCFLCTGRLSKFKNKRKSKSIPFALLPFSDCVAILCNNIVTHYCVIRLKGVYRRVAHYCVIRDLNLLKTSLCM